MRWDDFRRSDNVEENSGGGGGGFGGMRLGGGAIVVVVVVSLLFGKNPLEILALLSDGGAPTAQTQPVPAPTGSTGPPTVRDKQKDFVAAVLGDTEDVWGDIFQKAGSRYQPPKLVLFRDRVASACGLAGTASGPFYCPGDQDVYLDLAFFDELSQRFGAPGDFARAYVIAHEIGHHVQNQLGLMAQVDKKSANASPAVRNALSVRQELQADCFAGVLGHSAAARGALDASDIESGIAA